MDRKKLAALAYVPFILLTLGFSAAFGSKPAVRDGEPIPVTSLQLTEFKRGAANVFGKLEFLGGLVMATKNGEMGATSSIRMLEDQQHFVTVMDTGHWAEGKIERDASGRLSGITDYRIWPMRDPGGGPGDHKDNLDAEGLVLTEDRVYVSFERNHRISSYPRPDFETSLPLSTERPVLGGQRLRGNGGIEALLKAPDESSLKGALVFVAERSYDSRGNFIAGVQSGPRKGNFSVERIAPFDVTDGIFLRDGTFLLLERNFGLTSGIGMRIRRFKTEDIKPGAILKGETLMEADFSHQIDNMEGLDAFQASDGSTHLIVVSDDNHSLLERNLMLEFKILP